MITFYKRLSFAFALFILFFQNAYADDNNASHLNLADDSFKEFIEIDAIEPYKKHLLQINFENDMISFRHSDRYYTNGARIGYISKEYDYDKEANAMSWAKYLAWHSFKKPHFTRFFINLTQEMYTPVNKVYAERRKQPYVQPEFDYPYAGLLYLSFGVINRTKNVEERIGLKIGIGGPYAFAKEAQDAVHGMLGRPKFDRWDLQLSNRFLFNPYYSITRKDYIVQANNGFEIDLVASLDISLGNIRTHFGGSGTFRMGYNLGADFGPSRINRLFDGSGATSNRFSFYIFLGFGARIAIYNAVVQHEAYGYKLNPLVGEVTTGFFFSHKGHRFGYVFTCNSEEYAEMLNNHTYGALIFEFAI